MSRKLNATGTWLDRSVPGVGPNQERPCEGVVRRGPKWGKARACGLASPRRAAARCIRCAGCRATWAASWRTAAAGTALTFATMRPLVALVAALLATLMIAVMTALSAGGGHVGRPRSGGR